MLPGLSPAEFDLIRFENELFSLDTTNLSEPLNSLKEKYPVFSNLFFREIVALPPESETFEYEVEHLLSDPQMIRLKDTCQLIFKDMVKEKEQLSRAFANYIHFFSHRGIPDVYTYISGFSFQRFIFLDENGKDAIGLGLDMFLGSSFPYAQIDPTNPSFSSYLSRNFDRRYLPKKTMELLIDDLLGPPRGNRLLDLMIHNGKKWYLLDRIMPAEHDTIITELPGEKLQWCYENEIEIWAYLLSNELIYSTDIRKMNKLINPSPQGPSDMPTQSPGETANFIGLQIIRSFMNRYPDLTLEELIKITDAQRIINDAKYKPRKVN